MATHRVLYQEWEWRDSWDGPSPAAGSMHLCEEDRLAYIKVRRGPILDKTPETYEIPRNASPVWVEIGDVLFRQVTAARPGLRVKVKTKTTFQAVSR
jgi:hypothetical protein